MQDSFCSYYTNSEDITSYMITKLEISDSDLILEPSAGEGIFIDKILKTGKNITIDALDINKEAINTLMQKYKNNSFINIRETDTLFDKQLDVYEDRQIWDDKIIDTTDKQSNLYGVMQGYYDKVIGNPPYGAWQEYEKRSLLKKKYPGQYVKETYSLFLLRCLSVLKMHGKLSFIIPDTFLFINMHIKLRKILLTKSKINEILIFPSKFFPGISFGYSNLSIITLEKCNSDEALNNTIRIVKGFNKTEEIADVLKSDLPSYLEEYRLEQRFIFSNPEHRFVLSNNKMKSIFQNTSCTLGDMADIVTGFYTGDNLNFIRVLNKNVNGAKNYKEINLSQIYDCSSIEGIEGISEGYIPYIKSASKTRYLRLKDEWFVRWDKDTVKFYNKNKKSRFQNAKFYFKTGIGISMVKSKTIRAFLMENRVFDQSIVGIFPKDKNKLYYLLALMNSEIINNLIHLINPTANNSSNYIKLIPYIEPSKDTFNEIVLLVKKIIYSNCDQSYENISFYQNKINQIITNIYNIM